MVNRRQGTQRICTGHTHLTQHVNLDGTRLTQRDTDVRVLEVASQTLTDAVLGSTNLQAADLNGSELRNINVTLRADRQTLTLL